MHFVALHIPILVCVKSPDYLVHRSFVER
uniref:Uncharacterized protein n=1 Tax=Anguilla anguilla TaxID=7936 RepID=A0A0E9SE49_ANGAN